MTGSTRNFSAVKQGLNRIRSMNLKIVARRALRIGLERFVFVCCLLVAIAWGQSAPAVAVLPETAQTIFYGTFILGMTLAVFPLFLRTLLCVDKREEELAMVARLFEHLVLLLLALVAVRAFGVELAEIIGWVKANPDGAIALITAIIVVRSAFALAPTLNRLSVRDIAPTGFAAHASARYAQTPEAIHRTAVHEAGHLLLYGCLVELPSDLSVEVFSEISEKDLYRGHVQHSASLPNPRPESYLRWSMLRDLAGTEAEYIVLGDRADGSCGDNSQWLNAATAYLSSGFGEVFYAAPVGDVLMAHNRAVLNDLKAACVRDVREFLGVNRSLLDELAAAVCSHKVMDRGQLEFYLSRVVGTDSIQCAHCMRLDTIIDVKGDSKCKII